MYDGDVIITTTAPHSTARVKRIARVMEATSLVQQAPACCQGATKGVRREAAGHKQDNTLGRQKKWSLIFYLWRFFIGSCNITAPTIHFTFCALEQLRALEQQRPSAELISKGTKRISLQWCRQNKVGIGD